MNIFTAHNIYPDEKTSLKEHFSEFYEAVYVGFLPFFRMENNTKSKSFNAAEQITVAQAKAKIKELEPLNLEHVDIFATNEEYPQEKEIYKHGVPIQWKDIISNTTLADNRALNSALKTAVGAYKKKLERQDLLKTLNDYTDVEKIWHPSKGAFDLFTKKQIYHTFKHFNKNTIIIVDEFFEHTVELDLTTLSEYGFIDKIGPTDYYIYTTDREMLFAIEWDSHFYLVTTDNTKMEYIDRHFEGFVADEKTTHLWDGKREKYTG